MQCNASGRIIPKRERKKANVSRGDFFLFISHLNKKRIDLQLTLRGTRLETAGGTSLEAMHM